MDEENFAILNLTKGKLPSLPFVEIKKEVLKKKYELSLVFIGDQRSKKLNYTYREKNKPTNILSFPISENSGEIFINLNLAKKQAKQNGQSITEFFSFLLVHGMLHLKGYEHGSKMERQERKIMQKLKLSK